MADSIKLVCGRQQIDLTASGGRYRVGLEFVPPWRNEAVQIGGGTSLNRFGGGDLVGVRGRDRTFEFTVHTNCASAEENRRALQQLDRFLVLAGGITPLYLEYRAGGDVPEPIWGQQGAARRYEVLHGTLETSPRFGIKPLRESSLPDNRVRLTVKPYALGRPQRLCEATGGIVEDRIGRLDGRSLGPIIPEATTNKFTDPLNKGGNWSFGANIDQESDTYQFCELFGGPLHYITAAAATNNTVTLSINAGNTNTHMLSCYAKRMDGEAVTTDDCDLYYGSAQTTTFAAVPNSDGWYRLTASFAGVAAGTATGVVVKNGRTVIVTGFQLEEKAYATPLADGDMLGCAWSGTQYASTSTRTAATLELDIAEGFERIAGMGALRIVWKAPFANTHANDLYLFDLGTVEAYFNATDDKFYLTDGTNTASSGAQTFSAGDILVLHFTWGPSGLAIYKNGSSIATSASYAPMDVAALASLYIGSTAAGASQGYGPFMCITLFGDDLTSAEASVDYTAIAELVADGEDISPPPWYHGTGLTNVPNDNRLYIDGISGSVPANTEIEIGNDGMGTSIPTWLSLHAIPRSALASDYAYTDFSGTVVAGAFGGQVEVITVTFGSPTSNKSVVADDGELFLFYQGREIYLWARLADAGSNLLATARVRVGGTVSTGGLKYDSEQETPSADATYRAFLIGPVAIPVLGRLLPSLEGGTQVKGGIDFVLYRTSGSGDVSLDYVAVLTRPILRLLPVAPATVVRVHGARAFGITKASATIGAQIDTRGDPIELMPGTLQALSLWSGADAGANTITHAFTVYEILVTPRWGLL